MKANRAPGEFSISCEINIENKEAITNKQEQ